MTNNFEKDYAREQKNRKVYEAAKVQNNEAGIKAAKAAHNVLVAEIEAKGKVYCRLYHEYEQAVESGNTYLDISDTVWDKDVEELIACMKENGITHFTFSSTWSSAVETAWLFQKAGCHLEDLIEINSNCKTFMSDEYEKKHGYLFVLN